MTKRFTLDDLARYTAEVYKDSCRNLAGTLQKDGPSASVVSNILQYSRALAVRQSAIGEHSFLLMN